MIFAIAINKRARVHRFFAFGLELVNDDEITVRAFEHKGRVGIAIHASSFAKNISDTEDMSFENDTGFTKEGIFWFGKTLICNDLAKNGGSRKSLRLDQGHRFIKFGGKSGLGIILRGWGRERR